MFRLYEDAPQTRRADARISDDRSVIPTGELLARSRLHEDAPPLERATLRPESVRRWLAGAGRTCRSRPKRLPPNPVDAPRPDRKPRRAGRGETPSPKPTNHR